MNTPSTPITDAERAACERLQLPQGKPTYMITLFVSACLIVGADPKAESVRIVGPVHAVNFSPGTDRFTAYIGGNQGDAYSIKINDPDSEFTWEGRNVKAAELMGLLLITKLDDKDAIWIETWWNPGWWSVKANFKKVSSK